jgi:hypothetical protein
MRRLFRENRFELIALLLAVLGFLFLTRLITIHGLILFAENTVVGIRQTFISLDQFISGLHQHIQDTYSSLISGGKLIKSKGIDRGAGLGHIYNSISNFLGLLLILSAAVLAIWHGRYRFVQSDYWQAVECPRCGSELHRIHRNTWDRVLSRTLLPGSRRYRCNNPDCGWSGLRGRRESERGRRECESTNTTGQA